MALDEFEKFMRRCREAFGLEGINLFNWSEPLLVRDIADYVRIAKQHSGCPVALSSNMTVPIPDERIEALLENLDKLTFSVSGITQEVYEVYHRKGNIDRVMDNTRRFLEVRRCTWAPTAFFWNFGMHRENASDAPLVEKFCIENDITLQKIPYYVTSIRQVARFHADEPVDKSIWELQHDSYDAAQEQVEGYLTPNSCSLFENLEFTPSGYLLNCCADDVPHQVHYSEIKSREHLYQLKGADPFCSSCFKTGLVGYYSKSFATAESVAPAKVNARFMRKLKRSVRKRVPQLVFVLPQGSPAGDGGAPGQGTEAGDGKAALR